MSKEHEQKSAEELLDEFEQMLGDKTYRADAKLGLAPDPWLNYQRIEFVKSLLYNTRTLMDEYIVVLALHMLNKDKFWSFHNELVCLIEENFEVLRRKGIKFKVSKHELETRVKDMEEDITHPFNYLRDVQINLWRLTT